MNETASANFIRTIIKEDNESGVFDKRVVTRFPPEPNGCLHIGHAKSICLNFGLAAEFQGRCHMRFDDTNPANEETEYVHSIMEDVRWLGYDWGEHLYYASDYFEKLYEYAVQLIKAGKAYVDDLSADEIREYRGTLTEPGKNSPYRDRSVEENLDLFTRMRQGEFADGTKVLRAKIDMASPNIMMRDPALYRIRKIHHHRTGDAWCIYPMYDFTHCLSDSIEGVTHSNCTLEFENNREIYDWILDALDVHHPKQTEFARLNLSHTVLSKRRLITLVQEGHVNGWDDPRMPTISGLRRRGCSPEAVRNFCERIGVARRDNMVDLALLEFCVREDLNRTAPRMMAVVEPLKVVIENYPEGRVEELEFINNPEDPEAGTRKVPFSRELYIERKDFMENPPRKYFRMSPGREVRFRYAYLITCREVIRNADGEVVELRCTYDPETRGGSAPDGRKVRGAIHWVSAAHAVAAEVREYEPLFTEENPSACEDFRTCLNPESLRVIENARVEPALAAFAPGDRCQFERIGYFCADSRDHTPEKPVFNRTVTLRDTWARVQKKSDK
ncbi:MAG: glutamine--tRNA ligase [Desulfobacterales bacterium]|nr:MAG: glutamine--tRNA ligase [Desulfobacterales bacterium]